MGENDENRIRAIGKRGVRLISYLCRGESVALVNNQRGRHQIRVIEI